MAYEFLWQANDITCDELKNSVVKEEAERVAMRDYYVIVLRSQHAAILKYDQYKNAYIYMHRQTISINAFLAPTTRGTVVRSVTSGPGLLGKGGGTRVL